MKHDGVFRNVRKSGFRGPRLFLNPRLARLAATRLTDWASCAYVTTRPVGTFRSALLCRQCPRRAARTNGVSGASGNVHVGVWATKDHLGEFS